GLCQEFPQDRDLSALLADTRERLRVIRRTEDIQKANNECASLHSTNRYREAEEVIRRLAASYPNDQEIAFLFQEAQRRREDFERRRTIADVIAHAGELSVAQQFEEAEALLDRALERFQDDAGLLDARQKLESDWNNNRRNERVRQSLTTARKS